MKWRARLMRMTFSSVWIYLKRPLMNWHSWKMSTDFPQLYQGPAVRNAIRPIRIMLAAVSVSQFDRQLSRWSRYGALCNAPSWRPLDMALPHARAIFLREGLSEIDGKGAGPRIDAVRRTWTKWDKIERNLAKNVPRWTLRIHGSNESVDFQTRTVRFQVQLRSGRSGREGNRSSTTRCRYHTTEQRSSYTARWSGTKSFFSSRRNTRVSFSYPATISTWSGTYTNCIRFATNRKQSVF